MVNSITDVTDALVQQSSPSPTILGPTVTSTTGSLLTTISVGVTSTQTAPQSATLTALVPPTPSALPSGSKGPSPLMLVGAIVGAVLGSFLAAGVYLFLRKRRAYNLHPPVEAFTAPTGWIRVMTEIRYVLIFTLFSCILSKLGIILLQGLVHTSNVICALRPLCLKKHWDQITKRTLLLGQQPAPPFSSIRVLLVLHLGQTLC